MPARKSTTVNEEGGNQAKVKGDGIASTGTDHMEPMPSAPQAVLTQKFLVGSYRHPYQT